MYDGCELAGLQAVEQFVGVSLIVMVQNRRESGARPLSHCDYQNSIRGSDGFLVSLISKEALGRRGRSALRVFSENCGATAGEWGRPA